MDDLEFKIDIRERLIRVETLLTGLNCERHYSKIEEIKKELSKNRELKIKIWFQNIIIAALSSVVTIFLTYALKSFYSII
jgi:hypothetical protein